MIETQGISKVFGNKWALREVSFSLPEAQFLTIFGPNGAGKTTLIRVLATLSKPTSGDLHLAGVDLLRSAAEARRHIGVLSHQSFLYDSLTAEENLLFYSRMYDVPRPEDRVDQVLHLMGLYYRRHDPVRTYSRGMQQRLAIGRAILHDPPVLLLDEPYTGLDPEAGEMLRDVLRGLAGEGRTVIMTTHNLERGLDLSHRVAILADGRLVFYEEKKDIDVEHFRETYRDYVAVSG